MSSLQPLVASDVVVTYGDRTVLAGVDLRAPPGQRVGLVGENGSGTSTLLRVLAGAQQPDSGTVLRPPDLLHLPQDPVFPPGATVGSVLDEALAPLHDAVRAVEALGAGLADGGDGRRTPTRCSGPRTTTRGTPVAGPSSPPSSSGCRSSRATVPWPPCPAGSAAAWPWPPR